MWAIPLTPHTLQNLYMSHVTERTVDESGELLWKLWILQSFSWKTRYSLTISGTSKQERLTLISLQTLTRSFIYPFEEQLLTVTFLVTDSNRLLT